jgi:hypothetical protein
LTIINESTTQQKTGQKKTGKRSRERASFRFLICFFKGSSRAREKRRGQQMGLTGLGRGTMAAAAAR